MWFNKFLVVYKVQAKGDGNILGHATPSKAIFHGNTRRIHFLQVLVSIILIGGMISYGLMTSIATGSAEHVLPAAGDSPLIMGALLPLTGTRASYAEEYEVALHIAVEDVNEHLAASGSAKRVGLVIEDTRTDPGVALEKLEILASKGVRIVIGPATSAEVAAVKQYADENDILIVSMSRLLLRWL